MPTRHVGTAGEVAAPGGRHRRPESLADVHHPRPANASPDLRLHRHELGRFDPDYYDSGSVEDGSAEPGPATAKERGFTSTVPRSARHRNARSGRHSAVARDSTARDSTARDSTARDSVARATMSRATMARAAMVRESAVRPPVMGSHRAPGTLPIESWLLMGKQRQQVLLASLIAAGLLLLAVPAQQRQDGFDAVNAAAAGAIGAHATGRQAKSPAPPPVKEQAEAVVQPTASPSASAGPDVNTTAGAILAAGHGPGHSLRTTGTKAVALTFDDGPDPVQTPKILALLAQYQIKATFCLVGQNVQRHPEIVREIVAAGHTLCNHTWNHSLTIGQDTPAQIRADLAKTNAAIHAAVPDAKIPFFRAPGGNFTDRLVSVAAGDGMTSLYWEVDPRDWDHPSGETDDAHVARVIAAIRTAARPGAIVLSHDFNQPDTINAYAKLLPWLKENFLLGVPGEPVGQPTTTPSSATPTTAPTSESPSPDPAASAATSPETATE